MVDRVAFMSIVGALAAGGAGGYALHQQVKAHDAEAEAARQHDREQQAAIDKANQEAAQARDEARAATAMLTSAPVCSDDTGAAADCPAAGLPNASDEGLCGGTGSVAARRCKDFKASMKPKVAENAVACLNALKGGEQCDANRVALCGHEALMMACQESPPQNQSTVSSVNVGGAPPNPQASTPIAQQCDAILKGCSGVTPGVTLSECYRTMSGLNDVGRQNMMSCMKTHCGDKGFVGCEATPPPGQ